jgi:hypothetical protein
LELVDGLRLDLLKLIADLVDDGLDVGIHDRCMDSARIRLLDGNYGAQVESLWIPTRTHPTGSGAARSMNTASIQGMRGSDALRMDLAMTNRDHQTQPRDTELRTQETNRAKHLILPKID